MFKIKFPTKRIFRIFPILRIDGLEWRRFVTYLWNDPPTIACNLHAVHRVQSWRRVRASTSEVCTSTCAPCRWSCILARSSRTTLPKHCSACVPTPCLTSGCARVACCLACDGLCALRTRRWDSCSLGRCTLSMPGRPTVTSSASIKRYSLPYLTFGVGRLLHLPSAEAISVRPSAQPRCNQRSQWSAVKPKNHQPPGTGDV